MPKRIDIRTYPDIRLGLIAARKNMKLSQQGLADKANMARSIIAELERGKRDTTSATWKILKGLLLVDRVEDLWETYTYKDGRFIGSEGTIIKDVQKQEVISDVTLD